jgi:hypothetical protein
VIHRSSFDAFIMRAKHCVCFWFHVNTDIRAYVSTNVMELGTSDEIADALKECVCLTMQNIN